ncbi:MAG: hypothetical protein A2527_12810 [Candidatus Lambdaproteobacteria bacterium RIFOXYD2_FULL_50_16]|uniref:GDP-mannose pyrophosphatase n=1 Tax=Candidatus Lambdaproteobacteria bacterium RIFOXYD2_FULL_50_16 TaxID=1817772 RepID=A0A1F6G9P9_9PROT|nr:MAG: hypothetical protein A2527_12810 [Candidatus Lambdaproteobacteria bacterium RIFOXYD2_FULL_50_16]
MSDPGFNFDQKEAVFSTPWFRLMKIPHQDGRDFYALESEDAVAALTRSIDGRFLLVRQYRPAMATYTLEMPAGGVDLNETPAQAILREVAEETGYQAPEAVYLGQFFLDSSRLSKKVTLFFCDQAVQVGEPETGIELVLWTKEELEAQIVENRFDEAVGIAAHFMAQAKGLY